MKRSISPFTFNLDMSSQTKLKMKTELGKKFLINLGNIDAAVICGQNLFNEKFCLNSRNG